MKRTLHSAIIYKIYNGIPFKYTSIGLIPNIRIFDDIPHINYNLDCNNNYRTLNCLANITNNLVENDIKFIYNPPKKLEMGWCWIDSWWYIKNTDNIYIDKADTIMIYNSNITLESVKKKIDYIPSIKIIEPIENIEIMNDLGEYHISNS